MNDLENIRDGARPDQVDADMQEPTWQVVSKADADGLIPLRSDMLVGLQSQCSIAEPVPPETTIHF